MNMSDEQLELNNKVNIIIDITEKLNALNEAQSQFGIDKSIVAKNELKLAKKRLNKVLMNLELEQLLFNQTDFEDIKMLKKIIEKEETIRAVSNIDQEYYKNILLKKYNKDFIYYDQELTFTKLYNDIIIDILKKYPSISSPELIKNTLIKFEYLKSKDIIIRKLRKIKKRLTNSSGEYNESVLDLYHSFSAFLDVVLNPTDESSPKTSFKDNVFVVAFMKSKIKDVQIFKYTYDVYANLKKVNELETLYPIIKSTVIEVPKIEKKIEPIVNIFDFLHFTNDFVKGNFKNAVNLLNKNKSELEELEEEQKLEEQKVVSSTIQIFYTKSLPERIF